MPAFEYLVKDKEGKDHAGTQEAADVASLVSGLRAQGFFIIRVNEVKQSKVFGIEVSRTAPPKGGAGKSGKIQLDDLVVFSRQMATLVGAGIPIIQAIDILAEQAEKQKFRVILREVHQDIQSGKSFSDSLNKHSRVFSELYINLVRAGESSGSLEEVLDRLATYLEKTSALQKKVKSAMMYPATVMTMAFLITYGMLAFVIPKFAEIFSGLNAQLPAPTLILISVSQILHTYWYVVFGAIVGFIFLMRQLLKLSSVQLAWDTQKLKLWIFGPIIMKVSVSKFARTLATLVRSGVSILQALDIVSKTSGNRRLEQVITALAESVKKGDSLAVPLDRSKVFPSMVVRMISIGEETGELEAMLTKIADFYEAEVDAAVDGLTSLIEPLIIAFLGIVIGGIVIAMFLPILTMVSNIK